ncbi:MAG TPA: DUF6599 family protein [Terriglobia bacterium]|nr:DUF6599 family protein [Terriglobia bacterium]
MHLWRSGLIIAFIGVLGISGCHYSLAAAQGSDSAEKQVRRLVNDPLPAGVKRDEAAVLYKPDNLYEYIDGGADIYLLYDFQRLLHQNLKSGDGELTVDIYDMGKAENGFGMYAAERSPRYTFIRLGVEGYRGEGTLNFVQGRYYVKLAATGAKAGAGLEPMARMLSRRIGGTAQAPALLAKLPGENRVAHSEQFVRRDPLGHAFLAPAYVVGYAWAGKGESKLVVSVAEDAARAKARLDQFARHFKQSGECAPAADLGENGIRGKNSFEGRVIARTQGRYLIALLNPPEQGAEILKRTAQGLQ